MNTGGFNKSRCIENIYFMAKQQNVRIGDLESTAGVSSGYLSRLNKEGNSSNPGIECIANMARQLRVPLDILLYADLVSLTSTEQYLIGFIKKMQADTNNDKLVWEQETPEDIAIRVNTDTDKPDHILFDSHLEYCGDEAVGYEASYIPIVPVAEQTTILHNCYNASLNKGGRIYLMSITTGHGDEDYDLYLAVQGDRRKPVCSTRRAKSEIVEQIRLLYGDVETYMKRLHIAPEVKSVIDEYILPF